MLHHPIKTALLAYGMSGKVFHAPFLAANAGFELVAAVERTTKKVHLDYPGIKSYGSVDELLEDDAIELIIVNTPNYLHFEHCKAALEAGKHVLIEKPFTPTSAEAAALFELGRRKNLKVMVYQNRRYSSDFLSAKSILVGGKLGRLVDATFRFERYRAAIGPKAFKEQPFPGSGMIYDLGAHLLDQVISIFGAPESFTKTTAKYREGAQTDDYGHIHLKYANQLNVYVLISLLVAEPQPGIVLNGTSGSFVKSFADTQEDQSIAGLKPDDPEFGIEKPGMEGLLTLVDEAGNKTQTRIPGEKGHMMGIFDAAYQTIRNGADFPVKESDILAQLRILES